MKNIFILLKSVISKAKVIKIIRNIFYPNGIRCPKCGGKQLRRKNKKHNYPRHYECKCGKCFSEFHGTLLEHCKIDIVTVFLLIILMCMKLSFRCISNCLSINYKTACRLGKNIMKNLFSKRTECVFSGENEIDEVYFSAGRKGEHILDRKNRVRGLKQRGRGTYDKDRPPVLGIINRDTHLIHLFVFINLKIETIKDTIQRIIEKGSNIYTDEYCIYNQLTSWGYHHNTICHSAGKYALDYDGDGINEVHCNTAEGIWSLLRQYIRQFRGVRKDNLKYYVNFFEFLYNTNKLNISGEDIFRKMITKKIA